MEISKLTLSQGSIINDGQLNHAIVQLQSLLEALSQKELTQDLIGKVNVHVSELNSSSLLGKALLRLVKKKQSKIVTLVEKEAKIVPVNYYRNLWMALGMSTFGLPLGLIFALSIKNMAFLAIGLPIGLGIGIAYGTSLDNKAKEQGRQLDIELK